MSQQGEFGFDSTQSEAGHDRWLAVRRVAAKELARRISLPLGHMVEVWLRGNVRLRGRLRLRDEVLFIEESAAEPSGVGGGRRSLYVSAEMESCVRLSGIHLNQASEKGWRYRRQGRALVPESKTSRSWPSIAPPGDCAVLSSDGISRHLFA